MTTHEALLLKTALILPIVIVAVVFVYKIKTDSEFEKKMDNFVTKNKTSIFIWFFPIALICGMCFFGVALLIDGLTEAPSNTEVVHKEPEQTDNLNNIFCKLPAIPTPFLESKNCN